MMIVCFSENKHSPTLNMLVESILLYVSSVGAAFT